MVHVCKMDTKEVKIFPDGETKAKGKQRDLPQATRSMKDNPWLSLGW